MIADTDPESWGRNAHVVAAPEAFSILSAGGCHRWLKLPVTPDRVTCLARHQFFAPAKYATALASPELSHVPEDAPAIADGALFTGLATHWHFVTDGLGCLREIHDGAERTLYVDADLSDGQVAFAQRFAARAGMAAFREVERVSAPVVRVRNVAFPTRRRFTEKVGWVRTVLGIEGVVPAGGKRLFVLRNGVSTRRLLNQDEVAGVLAARFGFEAVDPGVLTLDEQVAAFRDARIVVGPHGAGLTDLLFAARPAMLVEIFHSEPQLFYHSLCYALGARHYTMRGVPVAGHEGRADNADYAIDAEGVAGALAPLLASE